MMASTHEPFADDAPTLNLPIDVLGTQLLKFLVVVERSDMAHHYLNSYNLTLTSVWPGKSPEYLSTLAEAWAWIEGKRFVVPKPGQGGNWFMITPRGRDFAASAAPLPRLKAEERLGLDLHPSIADKVRREFLLGHYQEAVLAAFREVEIRVRELSGGAQNATGVRLMRWAFGADGPLHHAEEHAGEQHALMELYAGAIGYFRNPPSHCKVDYDNPTMAAEVVLLADLLLRVLDGIKPSTTVRVARSRQARTLLPNTAKRGPVDTGRRNVPQDFDKVFVLDAIRKNLVELKLAGGGAQDRRYAEGAQKVLVDNLI